MYILFVLTMNIVIFQKKIAPNREKLRPCDAHAGVVREYRMQNGSVELWVHC